MLQFFSYSHPLMLYRKNRFSITEDNVAFSELVYLGTELNNDSLLGAMLAEFEMCLHAEPPC